MKNLRKEARGRECQIRIPGFCNFNQETTVPTHIRMNTGGGQKPPDLFIAWGCSTCHDIVDGRKQFTGFTHAEIRLMHFEGMYRTQEILISEGKI